MPEPFNAGRKPRRRRRVLRVSGETPNGSLKS